MNNKPEDKKSDQLPGVVVHSGEPVAWNCNGYPFTDYAQAVAFAQANMFPVTPLYTHPAPPQPSAEALVQAALEAASKACDARSDLHKYGAFWNSNRGDEANLCASTIRALSAQQIIESCKEKS